MQVKLSVRARLTIWFGLVFFLGILLLGVSIYAGLRSTIVKIIDSELSSRLEGVNNFLGEHIPRLPKTRLQQDLSVHFALKPGLLVVQNPAGDFLYCGSSVKALCDPKRASVLPTFTTENDLRILSATRVINGAPYLIRVASDLNFQAAILRQFLFWLLLIVPLVLISSLLGGYWLSGRALDPVRGIINEVHAIREHSLSMRLQVPQT